MRLGWLALPAAVCCGFTSPEASRAPAACAVPAPAGAVVSRPRYTAPERVFSGRHVVVHYVVEGQDAPPLDSFDLDPIPDYVQRAAEAGDVAVESYRTSRPREDLAPWPAFPVELCDSGAGGDTRPDIYIRSREGFGIAYPPVNAEGGAFVEISRALALRGAENTNFQGNGVFFTVLHEMFHLVQYAYVPTGLPAWVAEGTANAMAIGVDTRSGHPVLYQQLDSWTASPHRPMYEPGRNRERSYAGIGFWFAAIEFVPGYFERLAELAGAGRSIGIGLEPLRETLREQATVDGQQFPLALEIFFLVYGMSSYLVYNGNPLIRPIRPLYPVVLGRSGGVTRTIDGMSIHFVRMSIPRGVRSVKLTLSGRPRHPEMSAMLGIRGANAARDFFGRGAGPVPQRFSRPRSISFRPRNDDERRRSVLVIASAAERPVRYTLRYTVTR